MLFNLGRRGLLVVYTLVIAVPLLVVVFGSFKTQQQLFANPFLPTLDPQLDNYSTALFSQGIGQALVNSILVTVTSVTLTLVCASLAAYAVARIPGWKGNLIFGFLVLGMAIPAQANMIPQRVLFESLGLLDSLIGLVVINITVTLPVATLILGGFMKTLPPSLFEASSIDGAGPWRTFLSIAIPLSAPSIAATTIFLFVIQWNELLYPLLFIQSPDKKTLPLALLGFRGEFLTDYPLLFTGVIVSSLPIVVAYVFLQRYFVAGITAWSHQGLIAERIPIRLSPTSSEGLTVSHSPALARKVTAVTTGATFVDLNVDAYPGVHLDGAPGWLTGEDPSDLGVELTMPNLPDLDLPDATPTAHRVRVDVLGTDLIRIRSGAPDDSVFDDDGTRLGIVTDPQPGPAADVTITDTGELVELVAGNTTISIGTYPLRFTVSRGGEVVLRTSERLRQVAGLPTAPPIIAHGASQTLSLELGVDEDITGFGEQFGRLVKNGQSFDLRVEDALGTGTGMTYKPVPVWHSSRGYLGFLNTGARVTCDIGHTMPSVLALTNDDPAIDLYLVLGDTVADRLRRYTTLTGRGPCPPVWAFGYWMGRCRYHSSAEMLEVADRMRTEQVPCDVLHLDPDWLVIDRLNTDFIWNTDRFGDRAEFVADLAARGVRLSVWELPYLDPASPRYDEAEQRGYLVRTTTGATAHLRGTPTPDGRHRGLIDLTNPEARAWWQQLHHPFLDDGVAVFKTDFGEGLPDDAALADGTPPNHAHNLFPLRYNAAVSDGIGAHLDRSPLVWGRSGWAGSHRYPGQWGGDAESTVAGMQATVRGGLSYAISAPGFWSHDIGGFFGPELTPALYVRWTQFGALSPLMRAHGLRPREPWAFGDQALRLSRDWIRLRYSLLPYLWQTALASAANGWPMMRPFDFADPDDRVARGVDDAYLLGSDLLVAPVFADTAEPVERRFWVPAGDWSDLITGQQYSGPGFAVRTCTLGEMPVLVRHGAVLPRMTVTEQDRNTDDLLSKPWTFHVFGGATGERTFVGFDGQPVTWRPERSA